ncbi:MAG: SsrA-binding protein SmpB [Planctomycetaceae bacterium]
MAKKKKDKKQDDPNSKTVCRNRKARHEYDILDELECGIVLKGSEVKSIRDGKISIDEAYARLQDGELWLVNADIAEYPQATVMNHEPKRTRKLLLHKRELAKFAGTATQQGLTLIPLAVYFSRGIVKVKIALAKGRKLHDKRDKLRKKSDKRDMRAAMLSRK